MILCRLITYPTKGDTMNENERSREINFLSCIAMMSVRCNNFLRKAPTHTWTELEDRLNPNRNSS